MLCVLFSDIFDAEVVYNQCERDWPGFVLPQSWCGGRWSVSMFGQPFFQEVVGKFSCLWEAIHPPSHHDERCRKLCQRRGCCSCSPWWLGWCSRRRKAKSANCEEKARWWRPSKSKTVKQNKATVVVKVEQPEVVDAEEGAIPETTAIVVGQTVPAKKKKMKMKIKASSTKVAAAVAVVADVPVKKKKKKKKPVAIKAELNAF
jgi:hypothetical protein